MNVYILKRIAIQSFSFCYITAFCFNYKCYEANKRYVFSLADENVYTFSISLDK